MLRKLIAVLSVGILLGLCVSVKVGATENATYTYTISVDGDWTRTQDAYISAGTYLHSSGLLQPNDIFIKNRFIYVADTGNSRVLRYNIDNGNIFEIGVGKLAEPMGVFVADDGTVYVADSGLPAVLAFSDSGELKMKIERPDSNLFSKQSVFSPRNIVVTAQGNIFVAGEGAHEGLMQFDSSGVFQGYFAANKRNLSLLERIQELIFTDEQLEQLLSRTARPIQNIDISEDNLIYSVTQSAGLELAWDPAEDKTDNNLKLHNYAGTDILMTDGFMDDEWNFVDVAAADYGCVYALTYTGLINEYDSSGNLIFSFGGRSVSNNLIGTFTYASAIDTDEKGVIYVLDKEQGLIQVFYPNDFAVATHKAVYYLDVGNYRESEQIWLDLLKYNGMSKIAHLGYGKTLYYQKDYSDALDQFKIVNDKELYSECFWELRDSVINKYAFAFVIGLIILIIALKIAAFVRKRFKKEKKFKQPSEINIYFSYVKRMLRHPLDGFYYIKHGQYSSLLSATVIYVGVITVFIFDMLFRGFIFNFSSASDTDFIMILALITVPIVLWNCGNYMVAAISDGEGSWKQVYIGTAYALTPYLLITPFLILLTYVLTKNEAFIIDFGYIIILTWCLILLVISVNSIHNFNSKETVKTIFLTLFFMVIAIVVIAILYMVWLQVYNFIDSVWEEFLYHVQN